MVKHLLSSLAFLAFGFTASAQSPAIMTAPANLQLSAPATNNAGPAKAYGTVNFTYFEGTKLDVYGLGQCSVGLVNDVCMYIPEEYAGYKILNVQFMFYDASIVGDVKGWVHDELPDQAEDADVCVSLTTTPKPYSEGFNVVTLPEPYVIPEGGCYVGYTFTMTSKTSSLTYGADYPVLTDKGTDNPGGFYFKASTRMTTWMHTYHDQNYKFNSTLLAVLQGEFTDNEAGVSSQDLGTKGVVVGQADTKTVPFTSFSMTPIESIAYTVTDVATGTVSAEQTVENLGGVEYTKTGTFTATLPAETAVGDYEKTITITKVNGVENNYEGKSATLNLHVLSKALNAKVLEEEFTDTDCGWCPMGIVGLDLAAKTFPDNFVGIAIHRDGIGYWDDPMYNEDYDNLPVDQQSMNEPSAQLNRRVFNLSPYYGSAKTIDKPGEILNDIRALLQELPDAAVSVSAAFADDGTTINVKAETEFAYDYKDSPFTLGFVLVGNGLSGSTQPWWQYNYYAQYPDNYRSDENLAPWCEKDQAVENMTYNHVALLTEGIDGGIDGSVSSPVSTTTKQTFTTTFDVSDGIPSKTEDGTYLLQDPTKLQVVAFIFNTETGYIVNCDECDVTGGTLGIGDAATIDANATVVARYNAAGQRIGGTQKGLSIVRMSNGEVRKQVVK